MNVLDFEWIYRLGWIDKGYWCRWHLLMLLSGNVRLIGLLCNEYLTHLRAAVILRHWRRKSLMWHLHLRLHYRVIKVLLLLRHWRRLDAIVVVWLVDKWLVIDGLNHLGELLVGRDDVRPSYGQSFLRYNIFLFFVLINFYLEKLISLLDILWI